ncbi:unnamed protein product [Spirodela intermedia]|uniref:Uncharacterized protein n=1 Tax=Spirodela intermedia TaxID=51605 RepID=A0A7I8ID53_SPIIN|nr:unnamed protein product [Spirodela intermedia]CAA6655315.1 unnamed protein product [Spirodela intermedia]
MKCLCSGEHARADRAIRSSKSTETMDVSAGDCSGQTGAADQRIVDTGNIEEAESSLREGGCLNYESTAGRMEYNQGNIEAALHVFEGIDIAALVPKMKLSIASRAEPRKLRARGSNSIMPMSMHAVSLLFEAIFLKAKSLGHLGRFKEAAQLCGTLLDTVEAALPKGLPENFGVDCKLHDTLVRAVELLPELWKLAGFSQEAISSYRRALITYWNLSAETVAKIQKEFAIFLLHGGCYANPPNLRSQMDVSFIPRNNFEEAILLLMILLRKFALNKIEWDPTIIDHLTFALCVCGELKALARQLEEVLPRAMQRKERHYMLALCYLGEGDDMVALNLLKKILSAREDPNCLKSVLLASKICGENSAHAGEGVLFARRALANLGDGCDTIGSVANLLLGISLSAHSRSSVSDSQRLAWQYYKVIYHLSLENAEQRKLDAALYYAKLLLKLEAGSNIKSWVLLARVLSAKKCYLDAADIVDAALEQTGMWGQGELLQTKARIQMALGKLKNAVETYTQLLAILQLRSKSMGSGTNLIMSDRNLESETWYDLANIYSSISQWNDAEVCLSKLKNISPLSALRWHATGQMYEAKGLHREALVAYRNGLEIEHAHVPSLVSTATVLRKLGYQSMGTARGFLGDALRLDRTNHGAWFNLGVLHSSGSSRSAIEAAECFQAAALLEESAPVEPFR